MADRPFKENPPGLPKPADIVLHDFRPKPSAAASYPADRPIKILQWNIERGYKLEAIIEELRRLDADVLAIQEVDINCERSNSVDTGIAIAEALQLNYAFVCEFEELHSPLRDAFSQGGGVHGNAIMSKFEISGARAVEHTCHPVDWENPKHALALKEPRHGRRLTLAATVHTNQGPLLMYSAHLEVFCGMLARIHQLSDIFKDAREHRKEVPHQALLGDLNTVANGVARLSPNYCCDKMRWWTLGYSEGEVWATKIFALKEQEDGSDGPEPPEGQHNAWLKWLGLPPEVCRQAVNPGFSDPWDPRRDITLDHPKYRILGMHLMTGKLDWVLLRHATVVSKCMGNDDYSKSDHKWLMVEANLDPLGPKQ